MKISLLLFSAVIPVSASMAAAAIPLFQPGPSILQSMDMYGYSRTIERVRFTGVSPGSYQAKLQISSQINSQTIPPLLPVVFAALDARWPHINANPQALADQSVATVATLRFHGLHDSVSNFLRNFKRRAPLKPERGTIVLVGLCLMLYQMRRRPMRTAIGPGSGNELVAASMTIK